MCLSLAGAAWVVAPESTGLSGRRTSIVTGANIRRGALSPLLRTALIRSEATLNGPRQRGHLAGSGQESDAPDGACRVQ
jgi:hypothetical protein